jgi:hypothetical protein
LIRVFDGSKALRRKSILSIAQSLTKPFQRLTKLEIVEFSQKLVPCVLYERNQILLVSVIPARLA